MCHFIKVILPAQVDLEPLRAVMKRHGRVLALDSERPVDRVLTSDERAYLTTSKCDCGTSLVVQPSRRGEQGDAGEVARYRSAGWSEAKIVRWREQREADVTRKTAARARSREHEAEQWRALLADLLDARVAHVGLLVHWVTDDIRRGPTLPREGLNADAMASLEQNVIYTFTRRW